MADDPAQTPQATAVDAQLAEDAATAASVAAQQAAATAATVAAQSQELAAQKTAIIAEETAEELNEQNARISKWQEQINSNLAQSQTETAERFQRVETGLEALTAGFNSLAETLKSLTPPPSQEPPQPETPANPEQMAENANAEGQKAAQTEQRKFRRQRI